MSVLRLTSKKTLPILLEALKRRSFTQTELSQTTSIGRVNKIITVLKEKGIVIREQAKYKIAQPNRLADIIAEEQLVEKRRTYLVNIEKSHLLKELKKQNHIACLRTALSFYEDIEEPAVHLIDSKELQSYLDTLPRGQLQVNLYQFQTTTKDSKHPATTIEKTIIDLKSTNDGAIAEEAAQRLWGTRQ